MSIGIFYGSTTGTTEGVAKEIGTLLNGDVFSASEILKGQNYDTLILATSTWGMGDLQDDWEGALEDLKSLNLTGKKVAFIGIGDQSSFGDTFVDGIGILYEAIENQNFILVGQTPTDSYDYSDSRGIKNGEFLGLVIDDNNQSELTEERIKNWIKTL